MTQRIDLSECAGNIGLPWHEPAAFPMLADYECPGCGLIPTVEVVACTCGRVPLPAGSFVAGVTTVAVVHQPITVAGLDGGS